MSEQRAKRLGLFVSAAARGRRSVVDEPDRTAVSTWSGLREGNAHGSAVADDVNVAVVDQFVERRSSDAEHARRIRDPW